jgi:hypothetical protein
MFERSLVGGAGRWPKRSTKLPAIEERRLLVAPGEGSGGLLRSEEEDIVGGLSGCGGEIALTFTEGERDSARCMSG